MESLAAKDRARGDQLQRIQLAREAFAAAEKAEKKRRNAEALGKYAEADSALRDLDLAGLAPSSKEARELEQIRKIASEKAAALNQPLQPLAPTPTEK